MRPVLVLLSKEVHGRTLLAPMMLWNESFVKEGPPADKFPGARSHLGHFWYTRGSAPPLPPYTAHIRMGSGPCWLSEKPDIMAVSDTIPPPPPHHIPPRFRGGDLATPPPPSPLQSVSG